MRWSWAALDPLLPLRRLLLSTDDEVMDASALHRSDRVHARPTTIDNRSPSTIQFAWYHADYEKWSEPLDLPAGKAMGLAVNHYAADFTGVRISERGRSYTLSREGIEHLRKFCSREHHRPHIKCRRRLLANLSRQWLGNRCSSRRRRHQLLAAEQLATAFHPHCRHSDRADK